MFCFKSYKQQDHAVFHNLDAQLGLFFSCNTAGDVRDVRQLSRIAEDTYIDQPAFNHECPAPMPRAHHRQRAI